MSNLQEINDKIAVSQVKIDNLKLEINKMIEEDKELDTEVLSEFMKSLDAEIDVLQNLIESIS